MNNLKGKVVFITGASSGIGKATAYEFASKGADLILGARRIERLEEIKADIEEHFDSNVLTLHMDVTDLSMCKKNITNLTQEWKSIDILVNNAGLARGKKKVQDANIDDWEVMIDTNIKGLLYVSRYIIDIMKKRKKGHIINIGSTSGHEVYPGGSVYCATKHAVDAISKGMRLDLVDYPIRVTEISPGMVETEFSLVRFKGNEDRAEKVYEGFVPLEAKDVAEAVIFAASRPKYVQINEIILTSSDQANSYVVNERK
ncbi:MAG: SDR family NAD(P)-dependent oxidoreductase [Candidatus Mcinerneyibacterium aminivorans]|uniref:SDR family NAD(P)-dependent oxidoreductase n=1 Tax=Candidatus Mcinerneyibacterium aminivorans TaxID=2703815 RepID=A0A5D0MFS0_9BACT|nr:MAG: SDR family NAD(P)-dependent oxidoreductase [Candidatus Mcinerneyibacterium aminivorans]